MSAVLATWMRLKYPHIAIGALAASAPILQFEDVVDPDTFYNIVSNDFRVCRLLLFLLVTSLDVMNAWSHVSGLLI